MSSAAIPKATPFDPAVEEVRSKIEELKTTLNTLLRLQSEYGGSPGMATRGADAEISHDTFFNMTIGDAAKKYLTMMKVTKSTADIAEALERGGLKHSSKDFPTTVRSILGPREDFTRVPNGDWGITEWYPGMGRGAKKTKVEKPAKQKTRGTKSATTKPPKRAASSASGLTRKERILVVMKSDKDKAWTAGDIADATGDQRKFIQATMSVMAQEGELDKVPTGGYRLPKQETATGGA